MNLSKSFIKITTVPQQYTFTTTKLISHIFFQHTINTPSSTLFINNVPLKTSTLNYPHPIERQPINHTLEANTTYSINSSNNTFYISINNLNIKKDNLISINIYDEHIIPSYNIFVKEISVTIGCKTLIINCDGDKVDLGSFDESNSMQIEFMLYKGNTYKFITQEACKINLKGYSKREELLDKSIILSAMKKIMKNNNSNSKLATIKNEKVKLNNHVTEKVPRKGILKDKCEIKRKRVVKFIKEADSNKLKIEIKKKGNGRIIKYGDTVKIKYKGMMENGKIFDETKKKPFSFIFGKGEVIKGLDMGMKGMCVGERRVIKIPAELGYGSMKDNKIPADSNLLFDVELLS